MDKQSFSEINLMYEMCTMITCSTNSQGKFGNGNSQSDNFLQTGTLNGKGQFFGYTSTTQAVKVFYCENFFANYWKRFERSAAYQRSVSCESSSSVQLNRCGVHKHRTDTVRNIRRLLFKNGNGIRHRKNPDRCIRK